MITSMYRCDTHSKYNVPRASAVYRIGGRAYNARTHKLHTCGEDDKEVSMESVFGKNQKEKTMKIKATVTRKSSNIDASKMNIGDIGIVVGSSFDGEVLLRTYGGYVLLSNPNHTWDTSGCGMRVDLLKDGDTITLTMGVAALGSDAVILGHLKAGNKTLAIKERREFSGDGFKEAKEYVDSYERRARAQGILDPAPMIPYKPSWA